MKAHLMKAVTVAVLATVSLPAQAAVFDFTFTAPLTNGDTASGSGQITTADIDAEGRYRVLSATGSFVGYEGSGSPYRISNVVGLTATAGFPEVGDGYITADGAGSFFTSGLALYDEFLFDGIGFLPSAGASGYEGFFSEVAVKNATLTFSLAGGGVPEPTTWALLIVGMGAAGVALRRQQAVRRLEIAFA
ncbi:PEPxxWA-CTERM sorting domain-containing protein [Qipengyuania sp.]|uniref:PEPxxWA-CTERM sorting domain-containing protein n=1 Tax=Qipengyuania sp. TaxID=2004515 RepID=UPI0035C839FE